mgnify:CR=1 FL=1
MLIMFTDGEIELSKCAFFGGIGFYPVIFIGIMFCLSVSEIMEKGHTKLCNTVKSILCILGRYSFWIMCGHFVVFKVIDGLIGLFSDLNPMRLQEFPWSFSEWRALYFIGGMVLPTIIGVTFNKTKEILKGNKENAKQN